MRQRQGPQLAATGLALLLLTACSSAGPGTGSAADTAPTSTGAADGGALGAPEGSRLERSLHTTDLAVSVTEEGGGLRVTVRNGGPNPADDVWITIVPAGATSATGAASAASTTGITCERRRDLDECRLGPLPARQERRIDIPVEQGSPATEVTVSVEDRAGVDDDPADNAVTIHTP